MRIRRLHVGYLLFVGALVASAGFFTPRATALTTYFCGFDVPPNNIYCSTSVHHSYNFVSNSTDYAQNHLCTDEVTDAGNFKTPRNGTQNCATWASIHTACYNPLPLSFGKVWWGLDAPPGTSRRVLYGTAATGVSGCPT